jgi:hypothetical protein
LSVPSDEGYLDPYKAHRFPNGPGQA